MLVRWQSTIVDQSGSVVPGATVRVVTEATQTPAAVYRDRDGTDPYPAGVVPADGRGFLFFHAQEGLYRLTSDDLAIDWRDVALVSLDRAEPGLFLKADPAAVAFVKTGAGAASVKAGTKISVAGRAVTFDAASPITMPVLTPGADYAIWVKDDATIVATPNFSTAPDGGNWRRIGGFHYAPGGNALAQAGGDNVPAINPYSFWDLKFRPTCADPRGMALVAGAFWSDIYFLGVDHLINGTSKYGVPIAHEGRAPKVPSAFGGDGAKTYSGAEFRFNWLATNEVLQAHGKRMPTHAEYCALAYGTSELKAATDGTFMLELAGLDVPKSVAPWFNFTSRWGVIQASGCGFVWGGWDSLVAAVRVQPADG